MIKPIIGRVGGKWKISKWILEHIKRFEWSLYVEPFCGSSAIYFQLLNEGIPELIGISRQSVEKYMSNHVSIENRETIAVKGFDGDNLNEIVGYYATAQRVNKEVKQKCVNLLIQSSKLGFQTLIDKMAGIDQPKSQLSLPQSYLEALKALVLLP